MFNQILYINKNKKIYKKIYKNNNFDFIDLHFSYFLPNKIGGFKSSRV